MLYAINYKIANEWKHIVVDSPNTVLELSYNIDLYGDEDWEEYEILPISNN